MLTGFLDRVLIKFVNIHNRGKYKIGRRLAKQKSVVNTEGVNVFISDQTQSFSYWLVNLI